MMISAFARTLCATHDLTVRDVTCRGTRSEHGALVGGATPHLVLVRRGAFIAQRDTEQYVADPCTAMLLWEGAEYRVRHPDGEGDDCTVLELGPRLVEVLGGLRRGRDVALPLPPPIQVMVAAFVRSVRRGPCSDPEIAQAALELVGAIASSYTGRSTAPRGWTGRFAVAAIELIHRDLAVNRSVSQIADEIGCSRFHLMHRFRAEIGDTVHGYRIRARLGVALHRLAEGDCDLARLALDLGFASHSHLTDTFVRALGSAPSLVRTHLHEPRCRDPPARCP